MTNNPIARTCRDLDLSRNQSLRTLEVVASIFGTEGPGSLAHVVSTITSPVFSEVVVVYRDYNIRGLPSPWIEHDPTPFCEQFEALREMYKIRAFRLVLCADVWDCVVADAVRALERAVAEERAKAWSGDFFPEPLVISRSRGSSPTLDDVCYSDRPAVPRIRW